jgi:hypothetical protein
MSLNEIIADPLDPGKQFSFEGNPLKYRLIDFWTWNQSDLIENRTRGILAEFIVRQALELTQPSRLEWDAYDLITKDSVKIEVKSAAYIQAWNQKKYSTIEFGIAPTKELLDDNNYSIDKTRKADIYIFCLLHHKNQDTIDPMKLEQWTFYLVTTKELNKKLPKQKSISISTIETLEHEKCIYSEFKVRFNRVKISISNKI